LRGSVLGYRLWVAGCGDDLSELLYNNARYMYNLLACGNGKVARWMIATPV
jgi:hypothetical protein